MNKFQGHYKSWRISRFNGIIKYLGEDFFKNKTIIEVGAGHGDFGEMFHNIGAKVISTEGRKEHLNIIKEKYPHNNPILLNLEEKWPINLSSDIIIHVGVLYHLSNPEKAIQDASKHCKYLILETEVSDSLDPDFIHYVNETSGLYSDQAMSGKGVRPSPKYIEKLLSKYNFNFKRIEDKILNSNSHIYDWKVTGKKKWRFGCWRGGLRKFWICEKR